MTPKDVARLATALLFANEDTCKDSRTRFSGVMLLAPNRQGQVGGENRLLGLFFPSLFGSHNASFSAEFCLSHDSSS